MATATVEPKSGVKATEQSRSHSHASRVVRVPAANIQNIQLTLVGLTPLLVHRFGEKQIQEMEAKTLGEAETVKPPRNYEEEFQEARYIVDEADCYPCGGIKKTLVEGCAFVDGVYKTTARGSFFVLGEYAPILSNPVEMHKSIVRIGMGRNKVAQVRIRALYRNWKIPITIRYDANSVSADQIVFLVMQAGFSIGLGDWRPQRDGSFGMFETESTNGKN